MNKFLARVGFEHFAFGLILPISIIWKLQNGLSITEVASTESIILITTVIAEIPAGYFADKFSNRHSLSLGSFAHFIALLIMLYSNSFIFFVIAAIFFGIGWALVSGADEAHIHDDYADGKKNFQNSVSKMQITDEAGTIAGMIAGSLIASLSGGDLRNVFVISGTIMGLVSVYSYVVLPVRNFHNRNFSDEQITIFKLFIRNTKKHWLIFILLAIIYEYGRFLWQPKLESSGISVTDLGLYFALFKLVSILGSLVASKSHFSRKYVVMFLGLTLISLFTFVTTSPFMIISGLAVLLFAENFLRVWQSVVLNKMSGSNRASFLSSASLSRNLVGAGIIFMLGFPAQRSIGTAIILLVMLKSFAGIFIIAKYSLMSSGVDGKNKILPSYVGSD